MAEGTLARLTAPRATVADTRLQVMAVDTQLPVTVAEDIRRLLAVVVEVEEGHHTAVEVDPRTVEVGHRTVVVDPRTAEDMGGNTTLDSWPA